MAQAVFGRSNPIWLAKPGSYGMLYDPARRPGPILEAACWAHARRPFFALADVEQNARRAAQGPRDPPLASAAVRRIDALFDTERSIVGQGAARRLAARQEPSVPLVADLERWMRGQHAAAMYSLIVTAKLNDIDPQAWPGDILGRIADHPASRLDGLLP